MKRYSLNDIKPSVAVYPGEVLRDELEARGISQRKFAAVIVMPYTMLNEIVNGKRPVTVDTALKFEAALGIKADAWLNMQSAYNMQIASNDHTLSAMLVKIRKAAAVL